MQIKYFPARQISEQGNGWNITLYANFIDFAKALTMYTVLYYGRSSCIKIWHPNKIMSIMLYRNVKVICSTKLSDRFLIQTGVRQGCLLSLLLFNLCKTNIIGVLLHGSESCKVANTITPKLDTFKTRCLRWILKILWPNKNSNEVLNKNRLD